MANKKPEKAIDATVKTQLAKLTLDNERLKKENKTILEENEAFRKQNVQLASVIENDLKTGFKLSIQTKSNYKDSDLADLTVEQLKQIDETLSMGKIEADATYKSIRTGTASTGEGPTTVGSLFGKTRKEILEMEGDF